MPCQARIIRDLSLVRVSERLCGFCLLDKMAYLLATVRPLWHAQQTARPQWMCRQKLKASITAFILNPGKKDT